MAKCLFRSFPLAMTPSSVYYIATQLAARGPNPDLLDAEAGPQ